MPPCYICLPVHIFYNQTKEMKHFCCQLLLLGITASLALAQHKTKNLVIVTLDGMRWQEVFGGADSALLKNKNYTNIILPSNMINDNNVMLDDLTIEDLKKELNTEVRICDVDGEALLNIIVK